MKKIISAVAAGIVLAGLLAEVAGADQLQGITVQAERVASKGVGHTTTGVPIVQWTVSYRVSYADLDLTKHADVITLEKRVHDAARDACKELGAKRPLEDFDVRDCAKKASEGALDDVHKLAQGAGK